MARDREESNDRRGERDSDPDPILKHINGSRIHYPRSLYLIKSSFLIQGAIARFVDFENYFVTPKQG